MRAFILKIPRYSIHVLVALILLAGQKQVSAQVVNQSTKKKISIGVGLLSDIWMKQPAGIKIRAINPGAVVFGTYNVPFGKSPVGFSIGLGISTHNCYGNFVIDYMNDTTVMMKIPDTVSYKRSKINLAYLELPIEFRIGTNIGLHFGLGFKAGYLIGSSSKYVGDGEITTSYYSTYTPERIRMKFRKIKNLEALSYGPTLRIGYRWLNVYGYYALSGVFSKGKGPDIYPISVGIVLMPYYHKK